MPISLKHFVSIVATLILALSSTAFGQFGGRAGDVVIYAVTAGGSGDFQVVPPITTNSAQNVANFKITNLDSVPFVSSDPFPLKRKVFYMTDTETFQVGTDFENTIGLHRLNIVNVKILQIEGVINTIGQLVGFPNTFIAFPMGLDDGGDLSLEDVTVITWFPKSWPFIQVTDRQGPYPCPAGTSGFQCFFLIPGAVKVPSLMPWSSLSLNYPGAGWPEGIDSKLIDVDPTVGSTVRQVRLRPGKQTPPFRIPGHTHLFVLQGKATISLAGGATFPMRKYDYAFLPENFVVTLADPSP